MGPLWAHLGAILGHLGVSWGPLGAILGTSGAATSGKTSKELNESAYSWSGRRPLDQNKYLEASWGHVGGISGPLEPILGASWGHLEAILEPAGGLLGPSWGHPGPQKAGTPVETAGKGKISILRHLGAILRLSWGLSGHILGLSCATWGQLGASWGHLGDVRGHNNWEDLLERLVYVHVDMLWFMIGILKS